MLCAPVAQLPAALAELAGSRRGDGHRHRLDQGERRRVGARRPRARFVGGHPVCGIEARGAQDARAELFEGATWYLTPLAETEPARLRDLHRLVAALGATPVAIDAGAHDRLVALTSHLPHVLANLLVVQAGEARIDGHDPLTAIGGSFRDMTRVAGANPRIWVDIFLDNREALAAVLREHQRALAEVLAALEAGDAGYLARWIGQAAGAPPPGARGAVRPASRGALPRAGARARPARRVRGITQALGAARINIEDFELHHFTPERGGTVEMLVAGAEAAERAVELLDAQGYGALAAPELADAHERRDRIGSARGAPAARWPASSSVPGDKSVSHRSLLVGAVAEGATEISGFGASADTLATMAAVQALGVRRGRRGAHRLVVHGVGLRGLAAPEGMIDVHNAGTLLRLLPGLLGGPGGHLHARRRRVDPPPAGRSRRDAAAPDGRRDRRHRRLPADAHRRRQPAAPIAYELPVASAQVKSCILLAGLYAEGQTTVVEPVPTRDHTERMLRAAGARVARAAHRHGAARRGAAAGEVEVPGDISSAAFFIVAATLVPESHLFLRGCRRQPDAHRPADGAGADGRAHRPLQPPHHRGRRADRRHRGASRRAGATEMEPEIVPWLIDELPLLALAAARRAAAPSCAAPRISARRSPTASRPWPRRSARAAPASRRSTTAGASAACRRARGRHGRPARRPPDRDDGRDRRPLLEQGVRVTAPSASSLVPGFPRIAGARGASRSG